jgi:hypothetical protein
VLLNWSRLLEIRDFVPIADLGVTLGEPVSALPIMGENPQSVRRFVLQHWFKIGPHQYVRASHDIFKAFAWAASDGAFASVLTDDPFFDDGAVSPPPTELLPKGNSFNWQALVTTAQESGDEHSSCSERCVFFDRSSYYYRLGFPTAGEAPVCIEVEAKIEWLGPIIVRRDKQSTNDTPRSAAP